MKGWVLAGAPPAGSADHEKVEKNLKDHLIPPSCHGQELLPLDQVVQDHIQPGLEHFEKVSSVQSNK